MNNHIDINQTIKTLQLGSENFPHERLIAAITFGAFLHFPQNMENIPRVRTLAVCAVIRALDQNKLKPKGRVKADDIKLLADLFLKTTDVANFLIQSSSEEALSLDSMYDYNLADMRTAESISFFLLGCPADKKPSLNKAYYFLERDGFGIGTSQSKQKYGKSARTTSKNAWTLYGSVSCLLLAQTTTGIDFDLLNPEDASTISDVNKVLQNRNFSGFFGVAKHLQNRLKLLLPKESEVVRNFPDIPDTITDFSGLQFPALSKKGNWSLWGNIALRYPPSSTHFS